MGTRKGAKNKNIVKNTQGIRRKKKEDRESLQQVTPFITQTYGTEGAYIYISKSHAAELYLY